MKTLIPYKGFENIQLYSNIKDNIQYLEMNNISYVKEIWDNSDCTIPYNWNVISFNGITLFYSDGNDKLFKIYITNPSIKLVNGIGVNMPLETAFNIDSTLIFNELDEIYESKQGYWLEDDINTGLVVSLSVYVKEINNEDFDECKW